MLASALRRAAAPLDNKDGFWSEWYEATFERAAQRKEIRDRFAAELVVPVVPAMNSETWANPEVRAELKDHFIPVYVDQDSRPDMSQRYERWGWPATIIFGPDGTEIVKLRGFYSPNSSSRCSKETIKDPSPVNYGEPGGPERERTLSTGLTDASATRSWPSSTRPRTRPMAAGARASWSTARRWAGSSSAPRPATPRRRSASSGR